MYQGLGPSVTYYRTSLGSELPITSSKKIEAVIPTICTKCAFCFFTNQNCSCAVCCHDNITTMETCSSSSAGVKPSKLKLKKPTHATHGNVLKLASSAPPVAAVKATTKGKGTVAPTIAPADAPTNAPADTTEGKGIATPHSSCSRVKKFQPP
jgi:hypothetical protein